MLNRFSVEAATHVGWWMFGFGVECYANQVEFTAYIGPWHITVIYYRKWRTTEEPTG